MKSEEKDDSKKEVIYVHVEKEKSQFEKDYEKMSDFKNWIPFLVALGISVAVILIIFTIVMFSI